MGGNDYFPVIVLSVTVSSRLQQAVSTVEEHAEEWRPGGIRDQEGGVAAPDSDSGKTTVSNVRR